MMWSHYFNSQDSKLNLKRKVLSNHTRQVNKYRNISEYSPFELLTYDNDFQTPEVNKIPQADSLNLLLNEPFEAEPMNVNDDITMGGTGPNNYYSPFDRNDVYVVPEDRRPDAEGKYPPRKVTKGTGTWKGLDPKELKRRKGAVAGAKFGKLHPWSTYGAARLKRGTPWNLQQFGKSWKESEPYQKNNRLQSGYTGPGAYKWNDIKRGIYDVGRMVGRPVMNALQNRAVQMIGAGLLGAGSYRDPNIMSSITNGNFGNFDNDLSLQTNSLINNDNPTRMMQQGNDETNSITITNSEYIGDILPTATGFQTQYFLNINPGLVSSFPWLSNIAQFYEEYEFHQLVFTFKSMVTEGNSTASGTVLMCTQYNPSNAAFTSKQVMENYDYANSAKVTSDIQHGIECDINKRAGNQFEYVRTGPLSPNQDLKTYDLATFQLATTGATANLSLGELWVSYKIKLLKSKIPQLGNFLVNGVTASISRTVSLSGNILFGTTGGTVTGNAVFSLVNNTITFPSSVLIGTYIIQIVLTATTQNTVEASIASSVGMSSTTILNQTTRSTGASPTLATGNIIILVKVVVSNSTGTNASLTFDSFTAFTGTACTVYINQVTI